MGIIEEIKGYFIQVEFMNLDYFGQK